MSNYTNGPLFVVKSQLKPDILSKSCLIICTGQTDADVATAVVFGKSDDDPSMIADAALYAAAPELLRVCEAVRMTFVSQSAGGRALDAAIAKAKGEIQ